MNSLLFMTSLGTAVPSSQDAACRNSYRPCVGVATVVLKTPPQTAPFVWLLSRPSGESLRRTLVVWQERGTRKNDLQHHPFCNARCTLSQRLPSINIAPSQELPIAKSEPPPPVHRHLDGLRTCYRHSASTFAQRSDIQPPGSTHGACAKDTRPEW